MSSVQQPSNQQLAARVILYIVRVLLVLLAFRVVLALLGANPGNAFANFVYSVSWPFAAPFFTLFGYHVAYGVSRLEISTLVGMAVYWLIGTGLVRLVMITRPEDR